MPDIQDLNEVYYAIRALESMKELVDNTALSSQRKLELHRNIESKVKRADEAYERIRNT